MPDLTPLVVVPAWILGSIVSTTVHELGHAAAAWLCRTPVRVFSIGSQRPPILRWRQGETRIEIRPADRPRGLGDQPRAADRHGGAARPPARGAAAREPAAGAGEPVPGRSRQ